MLEYKLGSENKLGYDGDEEDGYINDD